MIPALLLLLCANILILVELHLRGNKWLEGIAFAVCVAILCLLVLIAQSM